MSFLIAAPNSGSGKTTVTLGILRAFKRRGISVRAAKSGPDYIDPRFHAAACGSECFNLDAWAMQRSRIMSLASGTTPLVIEGAMGLFDGAPPEGKGASADLAKQLNLPVLLVVDASRLAQSIAPLIAGFLNHDPKVKIEGVILNKVGSSRHLAMLERAIAPIGIPVFGVVYRNQDLQHPSRHLGLVQAGEHGDLEEFLERAADAIEADLHMKELVALLRPVDQETKAPQTKPPAQSIAIAQDEAFAFAYPHLLNDWRQQGASITPFSPLQNDLVPNVDFLFLPGGYPELHAARLSNNDLFLKSLRKHADSRPVYGECGGYMVLGKTLTDADGTAHPMAGLLPVETSFAERKLHLGYRTLSASSGPMLGEWLGHEFHYATTVKSEGTPLFFAKDAEGNALSPMGCIQGHVSGSFAHVIDRA